MTIGYTWAEGGKIQEGDTDLSEQQVVELMRKKELVPIDGKGTYPAAVFFDNGSRVYDAILGCYRHEYVSKEGLVENKIKLSIVIPAYRKFEDFRRSIGYNAPFFARQDVEVIIVLDSPEEEEPFAKILGYYDAINFKLMVNDNIHEWRNPAPVLNVGIRASQGSKVLVISPETVFESDVPSLLADAIDGKKAYSHGYCNFRYYPKNGDAVGLERFSDEASKKHGQFWRYGSICFHKRDFFAVHGYSEAIKGWGFEDNFFRVALKGVGCEEIFVPEARLCHYEEKEYRSKGGMTWDKAIQSPARYQQNGEHWGISFEPRYADIMRAKMPISFEAKSKKHKLLVVAPVFNEERWLGQFLENVSGFADGSVVLLDDGSTDGSMGKIKEAERDGIVCATLYNKKNSGFNDAYVRNELMRYVLGMDFEYLLWLDADETVENGFELVKWLGESKPQRVALPYVHVHTENSKYMTNYPASHLGVQLRGKVIRKDSIRFFDERVRLHFPLMPSPNAYFPALVKHFAMLTHDDRTNRYKSYKASDPNSDFQKIGYAHLHPDFRAVLGDISDLKLGKPYV